MMGSLLSVTSHTPFGHVSCNPSSMCDPHTGMNEDKTAENLSVKKNELTRQKYTQTCMIF